MFTTDVIMQVLKALNEIGTISAEEDLAPIQPMLNEAYKVIDKAVLKNVLHRNTGARRKSRLARARQRLLIDAGLYTPSTSAWENTVVFLLHGSEGTNFYCKLLTV